MLTYKISAKYQKGPEIVIAKFDKLDEAKEYIQLKLQKDAEMRVSVSYLLYDLGELLETFEAGSAGTGAAGASGGSGGGQQQAQNFRPNPLQTNLRPSGMPASSFKDVADDKKK